LDYLEISVNWQIDKGKAHLENQIYANKNKGNKRYNTPKN